MHDNASRLQWRLAVIEELLKGLDGFVRAATIQTNSGKTNLPIAKLYPLEINMMSWRIMKHPSVNEGTLSLMMI